MAHLVRFLRIFALMLLPFISCGDWLSYDDPCEGVNCDDRNPCTRDHCVGGECEAAHCVHDPVKDGTGCSLRGASGVCVNGVCDLCAGVVCEDDGNECIKDVCDTYTGTCGVPAANGTVCEHKGILPGFCASGFCAKSLCEDGTCDDGNECTDDVCDPYTGRCGVPADGTVCEYKGILPGFCASGFCAKSLCEDGTCDDGNECTDDMCDPLARRCSYIPLEDYTRCDLDGFSGLCLDGVCRQDLCEGVVCDDQNPCTDDICNYADGTCEFLAVEDGTPCRDGTGACQAGSCVDE